MLSVSSVCDTVELVLRDHIFCHPSRQIVRLKEALYRIWCCANRLGDGGVHTLGDNSAFVNPAGQLLLHGGVRSEWIPSA